MTRDNPQSQDVYTHQIWNSYLKEYRRYAPDSMQFLETRSEVKFKVTVTQSWYTTLRHSKMHPHTKFGIPTSNSMRYAPDTIILKTRSEVKVTVTRKWYATLHYPKMYPHTKFGIPTSKNIGDMDRTRKQDGRTDSAITICLPKFLWGHDKIYTIVKGRETFYRRHTVPVTSCSEVKHILKRLSFGSKDCTKELKLECAYCLGQTS